jgi:hypothetical protein
MNCKPQYVYGATGDISTVLIRGAIPYFVIIQQRIQAFGNTTSRQIRNKIILCGDEPKSQEKNCWHKTGPSCYAALYKYGQ